MAKHSQSDGTPDLFQDASAAASTPAEGRRPRLSIVRGGPSGSVSRQALVETRTIEMAADRSARNAKDEARASEVARRRRQYERLRIDPDCDPSDLEEL